MQLQVEENVATCYTNHMAQTLTWTSTHKPLNQDAIATSPNCVCIADGVTPLNTAPGDNNAMLTHVFSHALTTSIAQTINSPHAIRGQLGNCLMKAQLMVQSEGIQSTLTFAVWDEKTVAIACLGDSPAYVLFKNGNSEKVSDPLFKGVETEILEKVIKAAKNGKSWKKAYKKTKAEILRNRQARNNINAAWIADSTTPATLIAQHLHVETFDRGNVSSIVMLTDGVEVFHDPFGIVTLEELLNINNPYQLDRYYQQAAKIEKEDENRSKYPRFSYMDDATYAKINF